MLEEEDREAKTQFNLQEVKPANMMSKGTLLGNSQENDYTMEKLKEKENMTTSVIKHERG